MRVGRWLKGAALGLGALSALAFGVFAAGYALVDPGGWRGIGIVAGCVTAAVLLGVVAVRRPAEAGIVLGVLTVLAVGVAVADSFHLGFDRDAVGPVGAVAGFVVAVGLGCLGVTRPVPAGGLLVGLGLATCGVLLVSAWTGPERPPVAAILTRSSGIGVVPMLVVGVLLLVSGLLLRDRGAPGAGDPHAPTSRQHGPASPPPV